MIYAHIMMQETIQKFMIKTMPGMKKLEKC
jgi:hypothetical protein